MVTTNSDLITNSTTVPAVMNSVAQFGGRVRVATGYMSIPDSAFDAADDVIRLCSLPSNAVIHEMSFICNDMDNGTDSLVDIGLYNAGDADAPGAVIDIDCFDDNSTGFRATLSEMDTNFRYAGAGSGTAQLAMSTVGDAL